MLLVNHASATTLPETLPVFTAFMKIKKERSDNFYMENEKRIPKTNNLWIV